MLTTAGVIATGSGALVYSLNESVKAADLTLHAPSYPWPHNPIIGSIDMNRYCTAVRDVTTIVTTSRSKITTRMMSIL